MKTILKLAFLLAAVFASADLSAQAVTAPEKTIEWTISQENHKGKTSIVFTGKIAEGWHTYDTDSEMYPCAVEFSELEGCTPVGGLYALTESTDYEGEAVFFDEVKFAIDMEVTSPDAVAKGELTWMCCTDITCAAPECRCHRLFMGSNNRSDIMGIRRASDSMRVPYGAYDSVLLP